MLIYFRGKDNSCMYKLRVHRSADANFMAVKRALIGDRSEGVAENISDIELNIGSKGISGDGSRGKSGCRARASSE